MRDIIDAHEQTARASDERSVYQCANCFPGCLLRQIPGLVDRSVLRVKNFRTDLNERLEQVSFVAGERFSAADITALVTIDFAKALDISIQEGHRALPRWKDAVSARPSISA